MKKHYSDFLIVGGGVFGLSTAIELALRKYKVTLINPDTIPHHLAASTDISKAVRMEYGSDTEYFEMAEFCIKKWKEWNELFRTQIYHEVGFLMLSKDKFENNPRSYEAKSYQNLIAHGYHPTRLSTDELSSQFPIIQKGVYKEACLNMNGGYVESARAIELLARHATEIGVSIHEHQTAHELSVNNNRLSKLKTLEGETYTFDQAIIAAGPFTPYLVPDLQPYMSATGHPVFWLKPEHPNEYKAPHLPVFMADVATTGWYGFPLSATNGVVKVARHADGLLMHPNNDDRYVGPDEVADMRTFVKSTFPGLIDAPLVYTRRCLYADTLDGHFWIDHHPEIKGLMVSTGGSGHGMKMGPAIGQMTADIAERKQHAYSDRYQWRHLSKNTIQNEEARNLTRRVLS